MTAMREAMVMASSWSWVTMTQVTPTSSMMLTSSIWVSSRSFLSSAPSGSSSSSSCGRLARLRASATRCCWPPESWCGLRLAYLLQLHQLEHGLDALRRSASLGMPLALQAEGDVVPDRQVREQRVGLEHHVDRALVGRQPGQVLAVEHDAARRSGVSKPASMRSSVVLPQPEEPEQREDLALGDVEADVVDGDGAVAEVLHHVADLQEGRAAAAWLIVLPVAGRWRAA